MMPHAAGWFCAVENVNADCGDRGYYAATPWTDSGNRSMRPHQ